MFRSSREKKQTIIDEKVKSLDEDLANLKLSSSLEDNISMMRKLFKDIDVFALKPITNEHNAQQRFCVGYFKSMIDQMMLSSDVILPLQVASLQSSDKAYIDILADCVIQAGEVERTDDVNRIVESVSYGDTVLLIDGEAQCLIVGTRSFNTRVVSEPETERTLSGPREGFIESLLINLSLLQRRVRTNKFKIKLYSLGTRTKTQACICYIDGLVNEKILVELYRRLDKIDIDGVLDTNYVAELVRDAKWSPFRTTGQTERPDVVMARLLEGRIALLIDGSPTAITLPYLFIENFQSGEDYYMNYYYTSFSRMLRIFGFLLTILVPGFYIAIAGYHQEMLPTQLLLNIAIERQGAPFPASIEAFLMLLIFDILRETGVRMPLNIGQALSIVGALVIGEAAIQAEFVAAPMVIIVALTGITNLLIPRLSGPVIILRYFFLLAAAVMGLYGLTLAAACAAIHLLNLRSFGIPQIISIGSMQYQDLKDSFFRGPWFSMVRRPKLISPNKTRQKTDGGHV